MMICQIKSRLVQLNYNRRKIIKFTDIFNFIGRSPSLNEESWDDVPILISEALTDIGEMAHFAHEEHSIPQTSIEHDRIIWELQIPHHHAVYMTADVSNEPS